VVLQICLTLVAARVRWWWGIVVFFAPLVGVTFTVVTIANWLGSPSFNWWWGMIGVFFVPFGAVAFAVANWRVARVPFLIGILCFFTATCLFYTRSCMCKDEIHVWIEEFPAQKALPFEGSQRPHYS